MDGHNINAAQVATLQRGNDNIAGTADDVLVFAYVSVGEDNRPGAPVAGDGLGPRIDPRASDSVPLSSITNALGLPSPGGTGYASYYLDAKGNADGIPDKNATYGGCFVNAGAPAWWTTLKGMTIATDGNAGLDELLTTNVGKGLNCDGVFLDTIDTAAPNSFGGTTYEWTAPGMQTLLQRISTNYPTRLIFANRGLFFFDSNYKQYAYTLRPYINLLMFESYFTDSDNSDQTNIFFPDNKYDYAPKLNAEAGRPDGFTIVALGYDHTPPLPPSIINQDYNESMGIQGWPLYRTNPSLTSAFNTNASAWLSTNQDTQPPVWDSTAAQSGTPPAPRVGVQQIVPGDGTATVRWDVARDQTGPVRYNIYYTNQSSLDFATAIKLAAVAPGMPANYATGTGPGIYPYQYTITGLSNGVAYTFAVRAEDSAAPSHEDTNTVTLSAYPLASPPSGTYAHIAVDGQTSDWAGIPVLAVAPPTNTAVAFANLYAANDNDYLYLRFTLLAPAAPFSDFNTHVFIDTDANAATGYHPTGLSMGSELLIESGAGYDERNGSFNAGTVSGLDWALSPAGSGTNFEVRISRQAQYTSGGAVFNGPAIRVALQDNRGSFLTPQGVPYTFADGGPYENWRAQYFTAAELADPAISGDGADPDGDGIPNLVEYAFNLNPRVASHPTTPRAFIQNVGGQDYLHIQYIQRNAPAGVSYEVQTSADLITWSAGNFTQMDSSDNGDGTSLITMRDQSPITAACRFVRVAKQK